MRLRSLAFAVAPALAVALASGCATARKGPPLCPESTKTCLSEQRCELDRARDCMLCACRGWNDTGPSGGGPAGSARPEAAPAVPPPDPAR